jgi:hypothetical protein
MPDLKISQLPVATTPLAGTELVPLVQGGVTVQSTVNNVLTGTVPSGTANGVLYLNGSKVVTSGSGLTWDGNRILTITPASSTASIQMQLVNAAGTTYIGTDSSTGANFGAAYGGVFWQSGNYPWLWAVNGVEQMRLTSTGLGIGTSSPGVKLDVFADGGMIRLNGTSGNNLIQASTSSGATGIGLWAGGASRIYSTGSMVFSVNSTLTTGAPSPFSDAMTLDSSGNLGLGVTPSAWDASYKVAQIGSQSALVGFGGNFTWLGTNWRNVGGDKYIANGYATVYRQNDGAHAWFTAPNNTSGAGATAPFTQAMTLTAAGDLGIGTANPAATAGVTLSKTSNVAFEALLPTVASVAFGYNNSGSANAWGAATGSAFFGTPQAVPITFTTGAVERIRIKSDGQLRYVPLAADPAGAENGDVYYNSSTNKLRLYAAGAWTDLN